MKNFREFVRYDAKPFTNPVEAMRAVLTGIKAHEAARTDLCARDIPEIPADLLEYFGQK